MNDRHDMNPDHRSEGHPQTDGDLHPRVYAAVVGLSIWLILSVWLLFATGGPTNLLLFVICGFIVMAVALPLILSRVGHNDPARYDVTNRDALLRESTLASFRDWSKRKFPIWDSYLTGKEAATQILLPIAAVAFGMTIFGVALQVAKHTV